MEETTQVFRPDWKRLTQETVLVSLETGHWRARRKLTMPNLGLAGDELAVFTKRWRSLGSEKLAPPELLGEIQAVEVRARQLLNEFGFVSPWGRLIPKKVYLQWREATDNLRVRHEGLRDKMTETHAEWKEKVLSEYEVPAHFATGGAVEFLSELERAIPSPEKIAEQFRFRWEVRPVKLPEILAGGEEIADLEARRDAVLAELAAAEHNELRTRLEMERAALEERLKVENEIAREIAEKAADAKKRQIDDVVSEVSGRLRELLALAAATARKAVEKRGAEKVHAKTLEQVTSAVAQVRSLNFAGDEDIDVLCNELDALVSSNPTPAGLTRTLGDVETVLKNDLAGLGRSVRIWSEESEIPEPVAIPMVRAARGNIGLAEMPEPVATVVRRGPGGKFMPGTGTEAPRGAGGKFTKKESD